MSSSKSHFAKISAKTLKTAILVAIIGTLSSCKASTGTTIDSKVDENAPVKTAFPSVLELFSCKPNEAAFVAAHRGTHEGSEFPENTLESLQALHEANVKFAEIDVARLKDGTLILWHDGVWERSSNGSGPIAASTWSDAAKLLTKTTDGDLTSIRPSKFEDALSWAKDKMYLEIDLKSSASAKNVVQTIRDADMLDQVILISYDDPQAIELQKLAPEAALSVGIFNPGAIKALEVKGIPKSNMTGWTGRGAKSDLVSVLRKNNIPILAGSFFDLDDKLQANKNFDAYIDYAENADLVVTDFAFDAQPVLDLTAAQQNQLDSCLDEL